MMAVLRRFAGSVLVILALSSLLFPAAVAQDGGVLQGQVVNGTAGGPPVGAGVEVILHVIEGESEVDTLQAVTQAEGRFRFEGLSTAPSRAYWPEASYQGVLYTVAEPVSFGQEQALPDVTLTVYEATTDDSAIRLQSVHVIVEAFSQVLRVSEVQMFANDGDRAYVGGAEGATPATTVFVSLPQGAIGIALGEDVPVERFVEVEGGLRDTEPVLPGQQGSMVFLSYHLLYSGATVAIQRQFTYPVADFNILVTQPGLELRSEQLTDEGPQTFQGRQFGFYTAQDLPAGQPLDMELLIDEAATMPGSEPETSAPEAVTTAEGATRGSQPLLRGIGFALALLTIAAAFVYPVATRRGGRGKSGDAPLGSGGAARRLLGELADLQVALEEGRIDEADYAQRRAEIYQALRST